MAIRYAVKNSAGGYKSAYRYEYTTDLCCALIFKRKADATKKLNWSMGDRVVSVEVEIKEIAK